MLKTLLFQIFQKRGFSYFFRKFWKKGGFRFFFEKFGKKGFLHFIYMQQNYRCNRIMRGDAAMPHSENGRQTAVLNTCALTVRNSGVNGRDNMAELLFVSFSQCVLSPNALSSWAWTICQSWTWGCSIRSHFLAVVFTFSEKGLNNDLTTNLENIS